MFKRWFIWGIIAFVAVVGIIGIVGATLYPGTLASTAQYTPQTRTFTVTAVPLAVHEMQDSIDYLKDDFAAGGILDGKEVYGFYPSTLIVHKGDTVNLTLINPADDDHTFSISELNLSVVMKGKSATNATFVAKEEGVFSFFCAETEHMPFMWGQLLVLPDSVTTRN